MELLELLYPTSLECSQVSSELYAYFLEYDRVMDGANNYILIAFNFFQHVGTFLANAI